MLPLAENSLVTSLATALVLMGVMAFAALITFSVKRRLAEQRFLVDRINSVLPQTQCGRCGHPGCRPYARAIAAGEAINRCPPGGESAVQRLAALLNEENVALDSGYGIVSKNQVAIIREAECIGCTKCIVACPVDAIVGAAKQMHTVIEDECTGCDLCIEPCPVDCIDLVTRPEVQSYWTIPLQQVNVQ